MWRVINDKRTEHVSKFKFFGFVLSKLTTAEAECCGKVVSGRVVQDEVRSLVNARGLQLDGRRVWYEGLLMAVSRYGRSQWC